MEKRCEGDTSSCLAHYLDSLDWGVKYSSDSRRDIAEFTGISVDNIRKWYKGDCKPLGLSLVKVRYFLESLGYKISELENLDRHIYQLGKLIAFNKISYEDSAMSIGLVSNSDVLQILHGNRGTSNDKKEEIKKICSIYQKWLDSKVEELRNVRLENAGVKKTHVTPNVQPDFKTETSIITTQTGITFNSILEGEVYNFLGLLAGITNVLLDKVKIFLSDDFTPAQRQAFREKVGSKLVFENSNRAYHLYQALTALCSEEERKKLMIKGGNR